jgi:hypothetical protein
MDYELNSTFHFIRRIREMKIQPIIAAFALVLSTPLGFAQQQGHEAHQPNETPPAETALPPAETPTLAAPQTPTTMQSLIEQHLEERQSHWDKLSKTQDPAERQKLIEERGGQGQVKS